MRFAAAALVGGLLFLIGALTGYGSSPRALAAPQAIVLSGFDSTPAPAPSPVATPTPDPSPSAPTVTPTAAAVVAIPRRVVAVPFTAAKPGPAATVLAPAAGPTELPGNTITIPAPPLVSTDVSPAPAVTPTPAPIPAPTLPALPTPTPAPTPTPTPSPTHEGLLRRLLSGVE